MQPTSVRLTFAACCMLIALPASAATVTRVEVTGLPDPRMTENVRLALSLSDALGKDVSARRLAYLLREAEAETREALEPFGYYAPVILVQRSDRRTPEVGNATPDASGDPSGDAPGDARSDASADASTLQRDDDDTAAQADAATRRARTLSVSIHVDIGQPVRVRAFDLGVDGEARNDAQVLRALTSFAPRQGEVFDHALYDAGRGRVSRQLAARGYFDATFASRRVAVTRAEQAADIALRWSSGDRYALGGVTFVQAPEPVIRPALLRKLVDWDSGDPFDEAKLEQLRQSLVGLDYFGLVEVLPQPEAAQGKVVPVQINLTPAPRSIYTAGASYGTESGPGVRLGFERRYLNTRGHKALAQLDYADKRKTLTLQYRVPAFAWLDGWYSASVQAADEQTDSLDTRRVELVGSRSGRYNKRLNLVASAHVLRERWSYFETARPVPVFQYASFAFPSLRAEYIDVDNRLAPRRGAGGTLMVRGGVGGVGSTASFAQVHATAQWFRGFDADSRLILRGELGHTLSGDLVEMPPSLRFYAGGDRSIRGYGWREVGPRIRNGLGDRYALGARNVITASVEYERYLKGPWGMAAFIDTGSAFDSKRPDLHTGIGLGLRWRSPVGPVRLDIAHGLDSPDAPITLHLNIGADL